MQWYPRLAPQWQGLGGSNSAGLGGGQWSIFSAYSMDASDSQPGIWSMIYVKILTVLMVMQRLVIIILLLCPKRPPSFWAPKRQEAGLSPEVVTSWCPLTAGSSPSHKQPYYYQHKLFSQNLTLSYVNSAPTGPVASHETAACRPQLQPLHGRHAYVPQIQGDPTHTPTKTSEGLNAFLRPFWVSDSC